LLSLPPGTEMFQFPGFPVPALCVQAGLTGHDPSRVSPFGNPWIYGWLAPPQGLSQPPTSFIGSRCQGIHRVPLTTCRRDARARYGVLKDRRSRGSRMRRPALPKEEGSGVSSAITSEGSRDDSLRAAQGAHELRGNCRAWSSPWYSGHIVTGRNSPGRRSIRTAA
jgi:hypothetical protein